MPQKPPFWHENIKGYLSLDIICSSTLRVFLKPCSQKTVWFSEQIMSTDEYRCIFLHQTDAIVYLSLLLTLKVQEAELICYKIEVFDLNRKGSITAPPSLSPTPHLSLPVWASLDLQNGLDQRTWKTNKNCSIKVEHGVPVVMVWFDLSASYQHKPGVSFVKDKPLSLLYMWRLVIFAIFTPVCELRTVLVLYILCNIYII